MSASGAETKRPNGAPRQLRRSVLNGAAVGVGLGVVHLALRFALTPFILATAGFEAFGLWSLVFVTFGALGLHRSGLVGSASSRVARQVASRDLAGARETLGATATLALILATVALASIGFGAQGIAELLGARSDELAATARLLHIVGIATAIQVLTTPLHCALEALQRHTHLRVAEATSTIVEALVVFISLYLVDMSGTDVLLVLGGAFLLRTVLLLGLHIRALMGSRRGRALLCGPHLPSKALLADLLPLAGALQVMASMHLTILAIPRFAIGHLLGLGAVGAFEAGRKLVELTAALPLPAISPLAPASAAMTTEGRSGETDVTRAHSSLRALTCALAAVGSVLLAALVAASDRVSQAWLGEAFPEVTSTLEILAPAAAIHLATGPVTAMLRGIRKPAAEITYSAGWMLTLLILVAGGSRFGLNGALVGVAVSQTLACAWLLHNAAGRLGLPGHALLLEAARGVAVGAAGGCAGWAAASLLDAPVGRLAAALQLAPIAFATVAAAALTAALTLLTPAQRGAIHMRLQRKATSWA